MHNSFVSKMVYSDGNLLDDDDDADHVKILLKWFAEELLAQNKIGWRHIDLFFNADADTNTKEYIFDGVAIGRKQRVV